MGKFAENLNLDKRVLPPPPAGMKVIIEWNTLIRTI